MSVKNVARSNRPRSRSWVSPLQLNLPTLLGPFDEVDGVRPRRVFPDEVFSFEELNEFRHERRWTASRRRKSEV
jgi:hypothetical protein